MVASAGFAEFLREQLSPLGPLTLRRMFGKTGVFRDGLMFAMVADDTLYYRVDNGVTIGWTMASPPRSRKRAPIRR